MKCNECRYWDLQDEGFVDQEDDYASGICKRYPPVVVEIDREIQEERWPWTYMDDWCGEFKAKQTNTSIDKYIRIGLSAEHDINIALENFKGELKC